MRRKLAAATAVVVGLLAVAPVASAYYLSMSEARSNARSLMRKTVVETGADDYSLGHCYRDSGSIVYCRAKVYYDDEDTTCSNLVRIRAGNDGYNHNRVIDARCF